MSSRLRDDVDIAATAVDLDPDPVELDVDRPGFRPPPAFSIASAVVGGLFVVVPVYVAVPLLR